MCKLIASHILIAILLRGITVFLPLTEFVRTLIKTNRVSPLTVNCTLRVKGLGLGFRVYVVATIDSYKSVSITCDRSRMAVQCTHVV